jgi:hypothetical protein
VGETKAEKWINMGGEGWRIVRSWHGSLCASRVHVSDDERWTKTLQKWGTEPRTYDLKEGPKYNV